MWTFKRLLWHDGREQTDTFCFVGFYRFVISFSAVVVFVLVAVVQNVGVFSSCFRAARFRRALVHVSEVRWIFQRLLWQHGRENAVRSCVAGFYIVLFSSAIVSVVVAVVQKVTVFLSCLSSAKFHTALVHVS